MRCRALLIALLLTSCQILQATNSAAQAPGLLTSWPTVDRPLGMAIDAAGLLYVGAQSGAAARAHVYSQAGSALGAFLGGNETYGVAFLHTGELLLANYYGHSVEVFGGGGGLIGSWPEPGSNALYLAVDDLDNVYVTSDNTDHVYKLDHTGVPVTDWVSPHPAGVAYLGGKVYVAGMWNGLISIYAPDGTPSGAFSSGATWAEQLAVDAAGHLLLADHGLRQLKCFTPDGALLWTIGPVVPGYAPRDCDFISVVQGSGGTILAGDYLNRRVLVFGAQPTAATASTWGALKAKYRP